MKKKRNVVYFEKLHDEFDMVFRWNLCQKIAKILHHSNLTIDELKQYNDTIEKAFDKDNK